MSRSSPGPDVGRQHGISFRDDIPRYSSPPCQRCVGVHQHVSLQRLATAVNGPRCLYARWRTLSRQAARHWYWQCGQPPLGPNLAFKLPVSSLEHGGHTYPRADWRWPCGPTGVGRAPQPATARAELEKARAASHGPLDAVLALGGNSPGGGGSADAQRDQLRRRVKRQNNDRQGTAAQLRRTS